MKRGAANQGSPPAQSKARKLKAPLAPSIDVNVLGSKAGRIADQLQSLYPNPPIPLKHSSSFQLLTAVMLSAQSTDVKVNEVTPELFRKYPTAAAMANAPVSNIEDIIRVLGLAPTKAKNLSATSKALMEQHNGEVPDSFEDLEALPGIGHKTASVVMSQAFGRVAFPIDTHIHRLAQRWGLTNGHSVEQTEADLKALLPESRWRDVHLQIIYFGREHCPAVGKHDPSVCPICSWAAVPPYNKAGSSPARPGQKPQHLSRKPSTPTRQKQSSAAPDTAPPAPKGTAADAQQQQDPSAAQQDPLRKRVRRQLDTGSDEKAADGKAAGSSRAPAVTTGGQQQQQQQGQGQQQVQQEEDGAQQFAKFRRQPARKPALGSTKSGSGAGQQSDPQHAQEQDEQAQGAGVAGQKQSGPQPEQEDRDAHEQREQGATGQRGQRGGKKGGKSQKTQGVGSGSQVSAGQARATRSRSKAGK